MAARGHGLCLFYSVHEALESGVYRDGNALVLASGSERRLLCHDSDLRLRGLHNLGNAAAAAAAAATLEVPPAVIARGLNAFTGLPHRLEWIADKGGVTYYNDSKATTPFSTQCALQAFEQPVLLLAGGYDKGTPFDDLAHVTQACVRIAFLYGNTAPKLAEALERVPTPPNVIQLPTLDDACAGPLPSPNPARWFSSPLPAPATTNSLTTKPAATISAPWWMNCRRAAPPDIANLDAPPLCAPVLRRN